MTHLPLVDRLGLRERLGRSTERTPVDRAYADQECLHAIVDRIESLEDRPAVYCTKPHPPAQAVSAPDPAQEARAGESVSEGRLRPGNGQPVVLMINGEAIMTASVVGAWRSSLDRDFCLLDAVTVTRDAARLLALFRSQELVQCSVAAHGGVDTFDGVVLGVEVSRSGGPLVLNSLEIEGENGAAEKFKVTAWRALSEPP
jgi:hypothetical protein